jgi:hypothetical protein
MGSSFTKAKHKTEKRSATDGKAVNDKVRLPAKVGAALIAAKVAAHACAACLDLTWGLQIVFVFRPATRTI